MPLTPGTRLGPYQIESAVGAGGMGEVYRARDTRLDRIVAVKVLPDHVAAQPGWRDRFEREARSIAALNHPNICTLYDVGRDRGVDYLVMEHLEGETLAARLGSRGALLVEEVHSDPLPISRVRTGVPAALERAIVRLLAKDPRARFASAGELKLALGSVPTDTVAAVVHPSKVTPPSIAVLPFANLSADPENEYFAAGLTEEIIADLSTIRAIRVISRASAMRFKSADCDLRSVAGELKVRFVLQGSVRRAGTSLRITSQLVDAEQDANIWAEKYSGSLEDVFAIQEEISRRIVDVLKVRLTTSEDRQIAARPILDLRAYDCYLRARQELYKLTPGGLEHAEALVCSALEIVGGNALLHATEGLIHWMYVNSGVSSDETHLARADECVCRALALDPACGQAIFVRGIVAGLRGRVEESVPDLLSAYERNPSDANLLTELSRFLFNAGQSDAQRVMTDALVRVDPLTPVTWLCDLCVHTGSGHPEQAAEVARHMQPLLDPASPIAVHAAWQGTLAAGHPAEARDVLHQYAARAPEGVFRSLGRLMIAAIDQNPVAVRQQMTPALEMAASWQEHLARVLSEAYAQVGNTDDALRWLHASIDRGMINYPFLSRHDVLLEPIRREPRFQQLMDAVKRRWEAFPAVRVDR